MEQRSGKILDARPRERSAGSRTMRSMQSTPPIRRYVLLRQRGHDASGSRWSLERIAPSPRAARAPIAAQPAKRAAGRG